MLRLTCQCGETIDLPISFIGEAADCPLCGKSLRAVAGVSLQEGENVTARLAISRGPERIGEQFFLAGGSPVDIGKLPEKHIALMGAGMSRNHCRLIPFNGGWTLEDQKSTNGLFVNGTRVQRAELHGGDIIQVGEYELRYESFVESHAEATEVSPADDYGAYELAGIDIASVESMGRIQDRTREHLGSSDKAIIAYRKLLRQEIEKVAGGQKPMMVLDEANARSIQGPGTMDGIGPTRGWETYWMEVDVARRRGAPWAAPVPNETSATVTHLSAAE